MTTCSVIVPSYRSMETIAACLHALTAQEGVSDYAIIVVDSSDDATAEIIATQFPQVHLIRCAERTDPARARTIGAQAAQSEILAFIDSDCVAGPAWLSRLIAALGTRYAAAGGAITNANPESLVSWAGYCCEFREFLPGGPARDADNLTLGNAAYRSADFWAVGGFPAGYFPQEDQVFHLRLRAAGGLIRYDPAITVAHRHRSDWRAFRDHQRRIGGVNALVLRTIGGRGAGLSRHPARLRLLLPALVFYRFLRTIWACRAVADGLVWREPQLAWLILQGMWAWGRGFLADSLAAQRAAAGRTQPTEAA